MNDGTRDGRTTTYRPTGRGRGPRASAGRRTAACAGQRARGRKGGSVHRPPALHRRRLGLFPGDPYALRPAVIRSATSVQQMSCSTWRLDAQVLKWAPPPDLTFRTRRPRTWSRIALSEQYVRARCRRPAGCAPHHGETRSPPLLPMIQEMPYDLSRNSARMLACTVACTARCVRLAR